MPVRLTARCVRGLEWVLAAEVELYDAADDIRLSERQVSFEVPRLGADLLELRTADDLLLYVATLRGIDHTRAALAELTRRLARIDFAAAISRLGDVRTLPGAEGGASAEGVTFDVVASLLGRRNYNRYAVEDAAGQVVADAVGARYVSRNPDVLHNPDVSRNPGSGRTSGGAAGSGEASAARGASRSGGGVVKGAASAADTADSDFTVRLSLSGDTVEVALRVPRKPLHRRPWKLDTGPGTLHPPLAAALVRMAGGGRGSGIEITGVGGRAGGGARGGGAGGGVMLDPFCGDGTIAIEAALAFPDARIVAADLDAERLSNARANALRAGLQSAEYESAGYESSAIAGREPERDRERELERERGLEREREHERVRFVRSDAGQANWEVWGDRLAGFDAVVTNPPWNRAVGAAGTLADALDPFWRRVPNSLTSHGRICTIAEADLDVPTHLRRMGYSVALTQTIRLAGRVSHVVLAAPPGAGEVRLPSALDLWHERAIKAGIVSPDGF
jgi:tRNA (guanine6-N2)-methyltransferase